MQKKPLTMWYVLCIIFTTLCFVNGFGFYEHYPPLKDNFDNKGDPDSTDIKWIKQPLDHFDKNEKRFWKMMYAQELVFFRKNGPIYICTTGNVISRLHGFIRDLANETNGAMFTFVTRYYGGIIPNNDTQYKNLEYLNSRQILGDIANLIKFIKSSPNYEHSKVVMSGCHYGGNYATWMKLLHPDLVDAVIACDAPLLAKKDFYDYQEQILDNYQQYGSKDCINKIARRLDKYEKLFESPEGIEELKKIENICDFNDMSRLENKQLFFQLKIFHFTRNGQYAIRIKEQCKTLNMTEWSIYSYIFNKYEPNLNTKRGCMVYDFNANIRGIHMIKQFLLQAYQECTEMGHFITTSAVQNTFTNNVPLEFYIKTCVALFGEKHNEEAIDRAVANTNKMYGGQSPNVTNVIFVYDEMDPWRRLGVLRDLNPKAPSLVVPGTSFCAVLDQDRPNDSKELLEARRKIKLLIKTWILHDTE